jgi:hypothetical protein
VLNGCFRSRTLTNEQDSFSIMTKRRHIALYAPLLRDEVSEGISDDIMPLNI